MDLLKETLGSSYRMTLGIGDDLTAVVRARDGFI